MPGVSECSPSIIRLYPLVLPVPAEVEESLGLRSCNSLEGWKLTMDQSPVQRYCSRRRRRGFNR